MSGTLLEVTMVTWPGRNPPMRYGTVGNIVWAVAPDAVGVCGGVAVPAEGHRWSAGFPGNLDELLSVHGEVTAVNHPWLGFDTAHYGDIWTPEFDPTGVTWGKPTDPIPFGITHWTVDTVVDETIALAEQVASIR